MIGKKINQLATELAPTTTDLTIIGDPVTGVSKKITLEQLGAIFGGAVSFYTTLGDFPATGVIDIIYCAKDTKKLYLWSGSAYVEVFPSQSLLDTYQLRSEKGVSNGYASLDVNGKVPIGQLPNSIMEYKGTWNAATNTPTLANGTGDTGDVYICNAAGTVNFGAGPITFAVGDYVVYSGTIWQRSSGAVGTVTSVGLSITGDSIGVTGSPITTSGTLALAFAGTGAQYIKGDGTLATFPSIISQAQNLVTEVYNSTGATLTKGTIVYINGGQGNLPTVTKALATGDSTSAQTYGVVQTDITNMNNGYVVVAGRLTDLDTQAYSNGTQLYLSSTTAGTWTSTKQYAPNHLVYVGIVVRSHPTQGVVEIKIQNGYEMDELHNVAAQSPDNNDILQYKTATSLWTKVAGTTTNIAEGTNLYYTDARSRAALSFTAGSGAYNSTTGVITIPTNTNQLTNGAAFITLASLSAGAGISYNNTTGVIASTITQYTDALARAAISLTTTGTSGAATYNNTTGVLNIPQYQTALTNPVTGTGTNNYLAKFTTTGSTIGNSIIQDSGSAITITGSNYLFNLSGGGSSRIAASINNTSGNLEWGLEGSAGNQLFTGMAAYQAGIGTSNNTSLNFATNTVIRMTLNASGTLLVGATGSTYGASIGYSLGVKGTSSQSFISIARSGQNLDSQGMIIGLDTTSGYISMIDNLPLKFHTNDTPRLTIASTGAATFSSSVTATQFIANGNSTGGFEGLRIVNASTGAAQIVLNNSAQSWLVNTRTDNHFSIYNNTAGTTPFFINTSGNVGIGTTSPTSISTFTTLEIRGATGGGIKIGKTGFSQFNIQQDGTDAYFNNVANGAMYFYTNDAERMKITSGGQIEVTSANNITFGYSGYGISLSRSGLGPRAALTTRSNVTWVDIANSSDWTGATICASGGNVLVGTTTDDGSTKFQVNGAIKTAAPTNGTAQPWKLGDARSGSISTNSYIIVSVNGTTYSIPALNGLP